MKQSYRIQNNVIEPAESGWISLYRVAGAGALIAVVFILLDIGLTFTGGDMEVGGVSAVDWFAHFQSNWFMGLRNMGFFNVINITVTIPLYLALYRLHRSQLPAFAALALILYLLGVAVYNANNPALSILALSNRYAAAAGAAQKSLLEAAGTVILTQAEDFTPGSFLGFFFNSAGSLVMMLVMLKGRVFRKGLALAGLVGTACLLVFTIIATFVPAIFDPAMILAMIGGLLMLAWNILTALSLFRVARQKQGESQALSGSPSTSGA